MSGLDALQLDHNEEDDAGFIELVKRSISGSVRLYRPKTLHIIHIDDWFDHKWAGFSGKILGAVGVRKPNLTVPPFHPNRVLNERVLDVTEDGSAVAMADVVKLHESRTSETDTRIKLGRIYNSAIIAWYSGRSSVTGRAAIMLYILSNDEPATWYAGFEKRETWTTVRRHGVTDQELTSILTYGINTV